MKSLYSKWLDIAVMICALFLIVHDINTPTNGELTFAEYAARSGNISKQAGSALLFGYGVFALVSDRKRTFTFGTIHAALATTFFLLVTLSLGWSDTLGLSASRWFGLVTYVLAGAGSVKRLGITNIVRFYVVAELFYFVVGIGNELRAGVFHLFSDGYRFAGINDDNSTGAESAILLFASVAMLRSAPSSRLFRVCMIVAILIMLLTKSRTALFSSMAALLLVYGTLHFRGLKLGLYLYGLAIVISLPFVLDTVHIININEVVSVGRGDASHDTLTGRIPLWTQLYQEYVEKHPLEGYGYGAFWTPTRIEDISADQEWPIAAAHSIYLDSMLALGIGGSLLYVGTLMSLVIASLKLARRGRQEGFFFGCVLCALLFDGFSDSSPWFIASMYLFASVQAVFVLSSLEAQAPLATLPNALSVDIQSQSNG